MSYEDHVETYEITSYDELIEIIHGKKFLPDLRKNYIFRGVKCESYDLTPSSLRNHKSTGKHIIDEFIEDSNFHNYYHKSLSDANEFTSNHQLDQTNLHLEKEIHVLFEFFKKADKSGLKLPPISHFRENLHKNHDKTLEENKYYLNIPDFYEVISLAQHYGIPTRALDWTYDYKVAMYFATVGLLDEKENNADCVLWALNYRIFEDNYSNHIPPSPYYKFPLVFYRPEYNKNPNLNAQKGLFLIWKYFKFLESGDCLKDIDNRGLDVILSEYLDNRRTHLNNLEYDSEKNYLMENHVEYYYNKIPGLKHFIIKNNQKIFYKFVIPKEIKANILNELYTEGYSEEYLYPGYKGVALSIENKSKLNEFFK